MKELLLLPVFIILLLIYTIVPVVLIYDKLEEKYKLDPIWLFPIVSFWIIVNCISLYFII
jgi:hypothetical protein